MDFSPSGSRMKRTDKDAERGRVKRRRPRWQRKKCGGDLNISPKRRATRVFFGCCAGIILLLGDNNMSTYIRLSRHKHSMCVCDACTMFCVIVSLFNGFDVIALRVSFTDARSQCIAWHSHFEGTPFDANNIGISYDTTM